ncbi:DUF6502 family protein [Rhabdaerophilum sp. SD176]|uniref:DUF6502 family protein n=1 Tax=Rhabdaerophilum sp. SD176 TaxID=2983548 RepID=UPI0024DFE208|nr:DUF6502 family protein [Rhabdaerophilum sp. SD176]
MPERLAASLSNRTLLERGLRKVLRPIARAMIAHGLPLASGVAILKEVLVDVAESRLENRKTPSDSQISVLTGVHRKDVRSIRDQARDKDAEARPHLVSTVIGLWLADPRTLDEKGQPRPLPRLHGKPGEASFARLVEELSSDIRPAAVLEVMIAQDLVALDEVTDTVILKADAYVPGEDRAALYDFWTRNLHDHLEAATANVLARNGDPLFFERAVFYDHLSSGSIAALDHKTREDGMALLRRINKEARSLQDLDRASDQARHRFRFGMFFFSEAMANLAPDPPGEPDTEGEEEKGSAAPPRPARDPAQFGSQVTESQVTENHRTEPLPASTSPDLTSSDLTSSDLTSSDLPSSRPTSSRQTSLPPRSPPRKAPDHGSC